MSRVRFILSPKPPREYSLSEMQRLIKDWGNITWAANSINVSVSGFRKAMAKKKQSNPINT